jgi:hypothetical protein
MAKVDGKELGIPARSTVDFGECAAVTVITAFLLISVLDLPSPACDGATDFRSFQRDRYSFEWVPVWG